MYFYLSKLPLFPSEKGSFLKGKNLLPWGAIFFPFRVDLGANVLILE